MALYINCDRMYDSDTLQHLQKVLWDMAKDIISFCETEAIPYYGSYGTSIGAVRHHGFIPWDDDLDFCVLRKDYERFLSGFDAVYGHKYSILTAEKNPHFTNVFAKICLKETSFVPFLGFPLDTGISIDIYPCDRTTTDLKALKKQIRDAEFWRFFYILRVMPNPPHNYRGFIGKLITILCPVVHITTLPFPRKWIMKRYNHAAMRYPNGDGPYMDFAIKKIAASAFTDDDIQNCIQMPFEDGHVAILKNYHSYLTKIYGDYMKLPKEKDRQNHYPYKLDFGPY